MITNPQVLIVEDEPSMQILLRHHLSRAGFEVTMASNGLEGKSLLEEQRFDVICSDVMMSGIDGIELCRWAKEEERLRDIPYILLSSRAQHVDMEAGLKAGADVYLTKPFDVAKLVEMLEGLVGKDK
ncbi:MAG: response regulator [Candidatus Kapaibacterium sp.]